MSYQEASGHLCRAGMRLTVSTWNINSVRLRINLVAKFIKAAQPDVLCLQETKCPDDYFPRKRLARLGYDHIALSGQKGYHGVAVISRLPFDSIDTRHFCDKQDCRHIAVTIGERAGLREPAVLHKMNRPSRAFSKKAGMPQGLWQEDLG